MKKTVCLVLASIFALFMLSGCYSYDSTISINIDGSVDVTSETTGSPGAREQILGGGDFDKNSAAFIESVNDFLKNNPDDTASALIEPVSYETESGEYKGISSRLSYKSVSQMLSSRLFNEVVQIAPVTGAAISEGAPGIHLTEGYSVFGITYTGRGSINIDAMNQMSGGPRTDDTYKDARVRQAFEFPMGFSKNNAHETANFGKRLVWSAAAGSPAEVSFSVFVPNIALIIASLIIALLLVLLLVLWISRKKYMRIIAETRNDFQAENFFRENNDGFQAENFFRENNDSGNNDSEEIDYSEHDPEDDSENPPKADAGDGGNDI